MKIHMNLQLFAQPANHTGATGMSAEMKTYYEKRLLDQAEPLLVHDQFGDKYPIPANNGKTIEFRKYESLPKATEPLTEGVTPNAQALTVTPMTATVKQYGGWAAITDVLQLTAIDNNITQATKVLASQAGRTLDTVTREVLAGGTNVIYAPAGDTAVTSRANLTTASVLTPDLIDQAATALKAQNADAIGESYVAIVHPYVAYDLRRNPEWIDVHKYAAPENIHLFKDDDRYSAPVFVGVNGDSYLIQRGMDVKVPKAVAEVLEHSIKQDAEAARKSQAMQAAAGTQMMTI